MSNTPAVSPGLSRLFASRAKEIYDSLDALDPELNELIQRFAYDTLWLRDGLTTREKSIATLGALLGSGRERALRLHLTGFLETCGSEEDLKNVLLHLTAYIGFPGILSGFAILREVIEQNDDKESKGNDQELEANEAP
jgi:4-carboxymuconolactone decarboxylase